MNGGTQTEQTLRKRLHRGLPKVGQVAFGVVYAALFLFLFMIKPAPEQRLRASIGIQASEEDVTRLLQGGAPIKALPADRVGALLLTKHQNTDFSLSSHASSVVLTVETRWQVRGGLLGRTLDQILERPARVETLTASLRAIKSQAERPPKAARS